jgi:hypothetical protein
MKTARSLALAVTLLVPLTVRASDLPVTYNVQDKPLKSGAPAGTQLTFTLFTDAACTQQVYQAMIPVEQVTLISKLKLVTPKGATKAPTTDEIHATLTGVTEPGNMFLTVTGTGVAASGNSCQAQATIARPALDISYESVHVSFSSVAQNWRIAYFEGPVSAPGCPSPNGIDYEVEPSEAVAANMLLSLDASKTYACSGQFWCRQTPVLNYVLVFDLKNCVDRCADGVQNDSESDVDCGGGATGFNGTNPALCPRCSTGKNCVQNSDCASNNCQSGVCQ